MRAPLAIFVLCAGLSVSFAGGAGAQAVDSLQVDRRIHPTYSTDFRVFKERRDWSQNFTLNHTLGDVGFNTTLTSANTRDDGQNSLELDANGVNGRLGYAVFPGLNVGVLGDFDRSTRLTRTSDLSSTTDHFQVTSGFETSLIDSLMNVQVDLQGGFRESESSSLLRSGNTGTRLQTDQTGPSGELSAVVTNARAQKPPVVTYDLRVTADAFRQETNQVDQALGADFETITSSRDSTFQATNSNRMTTVSLDWRATSSLTLDVNLGQRFSKQVRPQIRQAALENTERDNRDASVGGAWKPAEDLELRLRLTTSDSDETSNITTSANRKQTGSGYEIGVDAEVWGIDVTGSLEQKSQDTDYRPLESGSEQIDESSENIRMQIRAERELSKKVKLNTTFDLALDQKFFDDGILDADRQDRTSDITVTWMPMGAFTGRLSVTEDRQRTVNLHPSRAGNTTTQQRVTVGAGYTYSIWSGFRFTQDLSVNAQSRTFDYADADRSDLTRNNRLTTSATIDVMRSTELGLEHTYNFRNSGQYALDENGVRVFTLNREFAEQILNATVSYSPATWLLFSGDQELRSVVNRSPGSEGTRDTRYELELFGSLKRKLLDAVQANLTVTRVLSSREDFYWRVDMTASRTFF